MKIVKKILIALGAIILLLVVISLFLPANAHVERSATIKAPASVVFEQINTLKNWEKWSPWHKIDTAMQITYEGPGSGVGAKYSWKSEHPQVGNGSLTITASGANDSIISSMDFMEGGLATGGYYLTQSDSGTTVRWTMDCDMGWNPIGRFIGLMMDGMIGKDFEKGLASLKSVSESTPAGPEVKVEETTVTSLLYVSITDSCSMQEMEELYPKLFAELEAFVAKSGVKKAGPAMNVTYNYDPAKIVFSVCLPVEKAVKEEGRIKMGKSPEGKIASAIHWGDYNKLPSTYETIQKWIADNGKTIIGAPWEIYHVEPTTEKEMSKWKTQVFFPIQ